MVKSNEAHYVFRPDINVVLGSVGSQYEIVPNKVRRSHRFSRSWTRGCFAWRPAACCVTEPSPGCSVSEREQVRRCGQGSVRRREHPAARDGDGQSQRAAWHLIRQYSCIRIIAQVILSRCGRKRDGVSRWTQINPPCRRPVSFVRGCERDVQPGRRKARRNRQL